jgi:hypothetical protein
MLATLLSGNSSLKLAKDMKGEEHPSSISTQLPVDNTAHAAGIVSADGFGIIASVGGEKLVRQNHFKENAEIKFNALTRKDIFFEECKHMGPRKFEFRTWDGEKHGFEVPAGKISGVIRKVVAAGTECPECYFEMMKKHTIRCCLCGGSIMPGEGVAIYDPRSEGVSETATLHEGAALGCLRMSCCPSGGFFAGHWSEEGFKAADFDKVCKSI